MFRVFSHLQRHPHSGIFYFRRVVPASLQTVIGKREIKKSLGTGERSEAIIKAHQLYLETCQIFTRHERMLKNLQSEEARRIAKALGKQRTKAEIAATPLSELEGMPSCPDGSLLKTTLTIGGKEVIVEGKTPDEEVAIVAGLLELSPLKQQARAAAPIGRPKKEAATRFADMVKAYFTEVKAAKTQTDKTIEENAAIFQLFQEVTRNPSVETISIKTAAEFKSIILRLPPNRTKKSNYRGKSISEILRMNLKPDEVMSNSSVNKYLRRLSSLFLWGKRHGFVDIDPFADMAIRQTKRPHQLRDRFTIEELKTILNGLNKNTRKPYTYWLPWLGLLTGARLEEICQLHLADIRAVDGVLVFDINDKDEKRLKTSSSERLIPIHPRLIELGFMEYVEALRAKGEQRLFPELPQMRDGYGQMASKWFARYRERLNIDKPFHSLRHTFIDELKQRGADMKKVAAIVGHADETMTGGRYGKPFQPSILLPVVEMLTIPS